MIPLYFGNSNKPLFGVYHPPTTQSIQDVGALLCYPGPQEYTGTHWAFRRLANLLCQAGFHVFRFDYFGTGDSSGESGEANVNQWIHDIRSAAKELKDTSGAKKISILGLRLGAALAARASIEGLRVKNLVLWDPVITGKDYINELTAMHHDLFPTLKEQLIDGHCQELLGYPFPPEMRKCIEQINLLEQPPSSTERISLIVAEERSEYLRLRDQLTASGVPLAYRVIPDSAGWRDVKDFGQALLVNDILHAIKEALSK